MILGASSSGRGQVTAGDRMIILAPQRIHDQYIYLNFIKLQDSVAGQKRASAMGTFYRRLAPADEKYNHHDYQLLDDIILKN